MKLAAVLCAFIGVVQFVLTRNLFGLVWIVVAGVLLAIDHFYGE